jgi:GrpB-like predicted nucleotidyltransferase (UPF0157 family)
VPVVVVDYDPSWPHSFDALRRLLEETLGDAAVAIEHVGSTAVPGLAAKPIIDVDVALADYSSAHELRLALEAAGFRRALAGDFADRQWYVREEDGRRTCHLSLTYLNSETWLSHRALLDRLLSDPEARREYGELKKRLAAEHEDAEAYTNAKTAVIERLAGTDWRKGLPRQPMISRRLLLAGVISLLVLAGGTAGLFYYSETSRGPDGLPDHRPIRAADLEARPEAKLFFPGSTVVASSGLDQSSDPSNPAAVPAKIDTLLATAGPAASVRAWYAERLPAAGWQAAPANSSGDLGVGETDFEWRRGSREFFELKLNLDRSSLGSLGGGVSGLLYRAVYLVGTGHP